MNDSQSFQRFAAITAIVSFPLALISAVLSGMVNNFSPDVAINPALMLSAGTRGAILIRWSMILDMLGNYLPVLPIALFMQHWLRSRSPFWVHFFTTCGLGFGLIGSVGAVALAAVQPPLIAAYTQASTEQRVVLETIFGAVWYIVFGGIWNILGEGLAGLWFIGIGLLLRSERGLLGLVGVIVGVSALLDSLGNLLEFESLALMGVFIYIILGPIWILWFGIDLLRQPVQIAEAQTAP
jgi:hypothetical protein